MQRARPVPQISRARAQSIDALSQRSQSLRVRLARARRHRVDERFERVRASIDARAQRVLRVRRAARVRVERARGAGDGAVEALDEGARAVVAHRASRRRARGDATGAPA